MSADDRLFEIAGKQHGLASERFGIPTTTAGRALFDLASSLHPAR